MRAKLGNYKVNVWQISMDKPENEDWLLEAFQMHQLAWSGKLVMDAKDKAKLKAQGMKGKVGDYLVQSPLGMLEI